MDLGTVNRFRTKRGAELREMIESLARHRGRDLTILDVGGRPEYWKNVNPAGVSKITVMNYQKTELVGEVEGIRFETAVGDARALEFDDGSFDLVHSNSVIEHVGGWRDMERMASEVRRVGKNGWIQTPAWEFPLEPHYRLPFIHWLSAPGRRAMLTLARKYRGQSVHQRRAHVDRINLLSRPEVESLFPDARLKVERVLALPKSYILTW